MLPRSNASLTSPPSTPAERLSSRLISCIESSSDTEYDIGVVLLNLPELPQLVATQNVALCNAVHLYLSAWTKAIRSLRRMISHPEHHSESQTLVAAVVLTKFEITFEASEGAEQLPHVQGVYGLLEQGGPPKLDDEMRINLAFQTLAFSFRWFIDEGMDPFFTQPEWLSAMEHFVNTTKLLPPISKAVYRLWLDLVQVAGIIRKTRRLARTADGHRAATAIDILQNLQCISESLDNKAHHVFESLFLQDKVCEVADAQSPLGSSYQFKEKGFFTAGFINLYAMVRIMVLRIRQYALELVDDYDATLERQCLEWSRVIWRCIPFGITQKALLASKYLGGTVFSFEAGGPLEREYVLQGLAEMNNAKEKPSLKLHEKAILSAAQVLLVLNINFPSTFNHLSIIAFSRPFICAALAIFGETAVSAGSPTPGNFSLSSIEWTKCDMPVSQVPLGSPVPDSVDCGRLTVPLDHYNPSHGTIELGMMRLKSKNPDCSQSLFYNSGGPGQPSSTLVGRQALWEAGELEAARPPGFSADLRASFNIIGLDLRGEGLSSPIPCDKDIFNDVVNNIALDDASFERLVKHNKALGESCSRMTGPLFSKMGTDQRIRDIELVRQASGSPVLNWIGWSGGSQIGVEYAELYPDKVGRLAIDGINTRHLSAATGIISEAVSFDGELDYLFNWCNSTAECALHGQDVASIFDELADAAEEKGLSAPACVGDKTCGSDVRIEDFLLQVMAFLEGGDSMPTPHSYYTLAEALAEAHSTGNATVFARKVAQSNTGIQEIFFPHINVLCSDYTRDHLRSAADLRSIFTPARVESTSVMQHGLTFCLGWPFNTTDVPHRLNPKSMKRLPPILIVNGLHDSATATSWAAEMRDDVPTGINVWRSTGGHTSYKHMGDTSKAMDAFLINGTLPWDGTVYIS
ncbi:Tripeptidyl aminopeptidase [Fusarium albosuccineum]|uniref:Tripeptidyl aminopeptidase n=1 Tax=Fusarium albosuccineum TaxID=1237068 RepID=A0A8H4L7I4_9HYPO|nr:Tripeptidyl aminopeptidase [Fusarium albosuccineum]